MNNPQMRYDEKANVYRAWYHPYKLAVTIEHEAEAVPCAIIDNMQFDNLLFNLSERDRKIDEAMEALRLMMLTHAKFEGVAFEEENAIKKAQDIYYGLLKNPHERPTNI